MKIILFAVGLLLMAMACKQSQPVNPLFNSSKLPIQIFTIDVTKETKLRTANGATILIPAGAIDAGDKKQITLQVQEAYSMEDILKGGLTTIHDGQPLSSAGMINIRPAAGEKATIKKPLYITVPSPYFDPEMGSYFGEEQNGQLVNWKKAERELLPAIPASDNTQQLLAGKKSFNDNCATCHAIGKDLTGPDLAHIVQRMKKLDPNYPEMLYAWTRNNQAVLASGNIYYVYQYFQWNLTPMNVYPVISNVELDALYAYIQNESDINHLKIPSLFKDEKLDTCFTRLMKAGYVADRMVLDAAPYQRHPMVIYHKENIGKPEFKGLLRNLSPTLFNVDSFMSSALGQSLNYADMPANYTLPVNDWGWYNCDRIASNLPGAKDVSITVQLDAIPKNQKVAAYLLIPSIRLNIEGVLKANNTFDFAPWNKLKIPPGLESYIVLNSSDTTRLYGGVIKFTLAEKQTFNYTLQPIDSKRLDEFLTEISKTIPKLPELPPQNELPEDPVDKAAAVIPAPDILTIRAAPAGKKLKIQGELKFQNKELYLLLRKAGDTVGCNCFFNSTSQ
ncbi:MAG: cytochrome c [Chitinophagaceae bacterium]|nr:cytochrome c [Chitinophagaceae bacterium]